MRVAVDPLSGNVSLISEPKVVHVGSGGGGGGGNGGTSGRTSYVTPVASDPATGEDGDMVYNYTENVIKVWWAGAWNTMAGGSTDAATFDYIDGDDFMFIDATGFDFIT